MTERATARLSVLVDVCVLLAALVGTILNPVILYRLDRLELAIENVTALNQNVARLCDAHPELRCIDTSRAHVSRDENP